MDHALHITNKVDARRYFASEADGHIKIHLNTFFLTSNLAERN